MKTVALVFGGRSAEHRVSVVSARTVAEALADAGFRVLPVGICQDGCWAPEELARQALDGESAEMPPLGERVSLSLARGLAEVAEADVLFPIVHGTWGEDGALQGLFEMLDIPYVGTDVTASAVCMEKALCKQVLAAAGLPVVPWFTVHRRDFERRADEILAECKSLGSPVFVKPSVGGSSVGVRKVAAAEGLRAGIVHALHFDDTVLVEQAVEGRELECAVLGHGSIAASGIGEIVPGKEFYDYRDKYIDDGAELIHSADLESSVADSLRQLAIDAFTAVGGSGMARVDFLLDADGPKINEINTLPGFTSISMYPKLWQAAGIPIDELVRRLVAAAEDRHEERRRIDDGIKEWISDLG